MKPLWITFSILVLLFLAKLFFPSIVGFLVPACLLFVPLLILPPAPILQTLFLDQNFAQLAKSLFTFIVSVLIVFPPYLFLAHYWMLWVFHYKGFEAAALEVFFKPIPYQLLMVALPEEFFFRGYLQSALNKVFKPRWHLFGTPFGWGLILTSLIFAFAHSVIELKWWHFSIFFPALLFGYLKERCGSITAPILFHAFSNSLMNCFAASYF